MSEESHSREPPADLNARFAARLREIRSGGDLRLRDIDTVARAWVASEIALGRAVAAGRVERVAPFWEGVEYALAWVMGTDGNPFEYTGEQDLETLVMVEDRGS